MQGLERKQKGWRPKNNYHPPKLYRELSRSTYDRNMNRLPVQHERIKPNRRPDYAYVNPASLRTFRDRNERPQPLHNRRRNVHDRAFTSRDSLRSEAHEPNRAAAHDNNRAVAPSHNTDVVPPPLFPPVCE